MILTLGQRRSQVKYPSKGPFIHSQRLQSVGGIFTSSWLYMYIDVNIHPSYFPPENLMLSPELSLSSPTKHCRIHSYFHSDPLNDYRRTEIEGRL